MFAAKDDVAVCTTVRPLRLSSLLFIQLMMNRGEVAVLILPQVLHEKYSVGRLCISRVLVGSLD